jgi:DNA-binding beta-propeller fold protein YncE
MERNVEERGGEVRHLAASRVFGCARAKGFVVPLVCGIATLFWSGLIASPAWASYEDVGKFPRVSEEESLGAMPLSEASTGVATDDETGEVYIADGTHARVERLSSEGRFLGAWGWNVIRTGPGKAGKSLEEMVTIERTSGGEDVVYKGEGSETKPISYEAGAEELKNELDKLAIGSEREGAINGEVEVEKTGPGTYKFTYGGALGDEISGPISVIKEGLVGTVKTEDKNGSPAFEDCVVANGDVCRKPATFGTQGGKPGEFFLPRSVAVDQANGSVYVLDPSEHEQNAVQVFTADGQRTGVEFGESTTEKLGKVGESEKNAGKLREASNLAVDAEGDSYIVNSGPSHRLESRISVFDATGEYIGSMGRTCGAKFPTGCGLGDVAVDSAGDAYTIGEEQQVYEFKHGSEPTTGPVCELSTSIPNLGVLAVDASGEVVAYNGVEQKFYWFDACAEEKFKEESTRDFENKAMPPANRTTGIAWNSTLKYPATRLGYERPAGVFYAINPAANPVVELNTGLIFAQPEGPMGGPVPPKVTGESVSGVGLTNATLNAQIEPYSDPIHYRFRYYSPEDMKCSPLHECEALMGSMEPQLKASEEVVSEPVSGLVPGATYHFRVAGYSFCNPEKAKEECALEDGLNEEFTAFAEGSVGLPDGRGYELVSPPFKNGGEVFPSDQNSLNCVECLPGAGDEKFPMQSTPDGEKMVYEGGPFTVAGGAVDEDEYFATRAPGGWATRDLSPATATRDGELGGYKAFSPDLSLGVFVQEGGSLSSEAPRSRDGSAAYPDVYLQSTSAPEDPRPLWTREDSEMSPPRRGPEGTEAEELEFVVGGMAGERAGEHVIFAANDALTPATSVAPGAVDGGASSYNLYDWMAGKLRLVNVLPGNASTQPGAAFGSGTELRTSAEDPDYAHAISTDGSHIFWTDSENHRVYARIDGDETVEIPDTGLFLTANAGGSKVLLNDGRIYDLETEKEMDLADGKGGFQGILGASEDLSTVYFVDTEILPGVETDTKGSETAPKAEGDNLYLWREGSPTRYIATLSKGDDQSGAALHITSNEAGDWVASPSDRTARVSPDGRYAAFVSEASLTGYDNAPASGECAPVGPGCDEVFEYDTESNGLVCVSCNPTKERPVGSSALSLIKPGSGFMAQPSNLLDDGRVFFDSIDVLSPQDKYPGVENVYEYEPNEIGSCSERKEGCIFMISTGMEEADSSFVNATPSGGDVYFTTRSELVPQDQDELMDLYDAREGGGGFTTETPAQPCTDSETCQGSAPSSSSAIVETQPSAQPSGTLPGMGNIPTTTTPAPPPPPVHLTPAQLLAKALGACRHRFKAHHVKRVACEKSARERYGHSAVRKKTARKK